MKNKINISKLIALLLLIAIISITGCSPVEYNNNINNNKIDEIPISSSSQENKILKFNNIEELQDYLKQNEDYNTYNSYYEGRGASKLEFLDSEIAVQAGVQAEEKTSSSTANEYSTTNIQVENVDEADFIKNDNKYIYIISNNELVIIDAYPAENANILSKTKIEGNPSELFINNNTLVIFSTNYVQRPTVSEYNFIPTTEYVDVTNIYIYDTNDKNNPIQIENYTVDGYYSEARMIGDYVYFISKDYVYYYNDFISTPGIWSGSSKIVTPDIYYFDNPDDSYVFHTVGSFNIFEKESIEAKTLMLGYSNTIMFSENNIYITYQKNYPYSFYKTQNIEMFEDVIIELLPSETQNKVKNLNKNKLDKKAYMQEIKLILEEMYNTMNESEKDDLIDIIQNTTSEYETKKQEERQKTIIHKLSIDNGKIEYETQNEVKGTLLNQFSLDEYENNLRIATTTSYWHNEKGRIQYNNVYILDENLKTIGKLENIAEDEKIYSTRFIGDKLYMVTFRQMDPFFVIDLSNPENPEILGALKIPGYSDYLHPYDENHIIGIGKETGENEWGGTSTKGIKIALFDVSDFSNPIQIDKYEIGLSGSSSEISNDHKAFLFDKKKNLLVLPVTEVTSENYYNPKLQYYTRDTWYGAYVFNIDENGFSLDGKIKHGDNSDNNRYYYYYYKNVVRRSLYLDNILYTVSDNKILMNDLDNDLEEVNKITLITRN